MRYYITEGTHQLVITCDREEQEEMRAHRADQMKLQEHFVISDLVWGTPMHEAEVLENLICNSELEWLPQRSPADAGLGIRDSKDAGQDSWIAKWVYSDPTLSFVDDLADHRYCVWNGGFKDPHRKPQPWERNPVIELRQMADDTDHSWIKVNRWAPTGMPTDMAALEKHHEKETAFLIGRVRQLARELLREQQSNLPE